jgi:hypothetical protein
MTKRQNEREPAEASPHEPVKLPRPRPARIGREGMRTMTYSEVALTAMAVALWVFVLFGADLL